jgi:uncharacterized membrane protein YfcA
VQGEKLNILEFTVTVWATSLAAGFLGALTGLGGGVIIIPALSLIFGVDIRYAIGASLISVIATSSGAAAAYVKEGFTNIRIGMFLEIATTIGALSGAFIAMGVSTNVLAVIFGLVLLWSAYESSRPRAERIPCVNPDRLAVRLKMDSNYPTDSGLQKYCVRAIPGGLGLMYLAGVLSGLLGIGSGAMKVIAMDQVMKVPFKVSTTTSNFMIGVTAAASAGVYLNRGYVDPGVVMPVMLGVLGGSMFGTRILVRARTGMLRRVFALAIGLLALEMIYKGMTGRI